MQHNTSTLTRSYIKEQITFFLLYPISFHQMQIIRIKKKSSQGCSKTTQFLSDQSMATEARYQNGKEKERIYTQALQQIQSNYFILVTSQLPKTGLSRKVKYKQRKLCFNLSRQDRALIYTSAEQSSSSGYLSCFYQFKIYL